MCELLAEIHFVFEIGDTIFRITYMQSVIFNCLIFTVDLCTLLVTQLINLSWHPCKICRLNIWHMIRATCYFGTILEIICIFSSYLVIYFCDKNVSCNIFYLQAIHTVLYTVYIYIYIYNTHICGCNYVQHVQTF